MQIFYYASPHNFLKRLTDKYNAIHNDSLDVDKALDFCLAAWSMADWVYRWKYPHPLEKRSDESKRLDQFRQIEIFAKCAEMEIMSDIANGTKHFKLTRPIKDIESLDVKSTGAFSTAFSFGFDRPSLNVKFQNGEVIILNVAIKTVYKFWLTYLAQ